MDLGIIGLARTGKTTVFNALTGGHAETASFGRTGLEHNVGVVKVPDPRLDQLNVLTKPKKITPAEVRYLDFGGLPPNFGKGEGISGPLLNAMGAVDALIHVVRFFPDPGVPHPLGSVNPARDFEAMDLELAYSDAGLVERRLERLANTMKSAKPSEREAAAHESEWLLQVKVLLEDGKPVRELELSETQRLALSSFALLTAKPLLIVLNLDESQLSEAPSIEQDYRARFQRPQTDILSLCGKLEAELAQMEPAEAEEFREAMGLDQPGRDRVIRASYVLVGLLSFFTVGPDENRAWTVNRGALAPQAAGKIHSDMEKGFIRAETVGYEELMRAGGWNEAKRLGLIRTEGRTYTVQDGDVMNILFSRPAS